MKIFRDRKYGIVSGILKYSFVFVIILALFTPFIFVGAAGVAVDAGIKNPLGEKLVDLPSFIKAVVEIVLVVGIPLLALAIIYAGFLFVKAQGNSEELTKAKHALLYTVIGGALLLGAFIISNAIVSTVNQIGDGV